MYLANSEYTVTPYIVSWLLQPSATKVNLHLTAEETAFQSRELQMEYTQPRGVAGKVIDSNQWAAKAVSTLKDPSQHTPSIPYLCTAQRQDSTRAKGENTLSEDSLSATKNSKNTFETYPTTSAMSQLEAYWLIYLQANLENPEFLVTARDVLLPQGKMPGSDTYWLYYYTGEVYLLPRCP